MKVRIKTLEELGGKLPLFVTKPLSEADKCIWLLENGNCDLDKKPKKCEIFRYERVDK